jgi:hypothetical protein
MMSSAQLNRALVGNRRTSLDSRPSLKRRTSLNVRSQVGRESVNRLQYRQLVSRQLQQMDPKLSTTAASVTGASAAGRANVTGTDVLAAAGSANGSLDKLAAAPAVNLSKQQLEEVGLLLDCFRQRTVYVVGGVRVEARSGSNFLRRAMLCAYRILNGNTQRAPAAWQVPYEQLIEITMNIKA